MAATELDQARAEQFAGRMLEILNDTGIALLTSVGHRTGIFEAMAGRPPSTSAEIAEAAGLQERYVREWLRGMAVGRIVEYDPAEERYALPAEHAAFLTPAAGPDNLAAFAEYIPLLAQVEDGIVDSFQNGGGVPYSEYPRFQQLQAAETAPIFDATLVDATLPLVPGLVDRLNAGIEVADVGCGSGHAINVMASAFPQSRFVGYDFSDEGVAAGRAEAERLGLDNATFEVKDVSTLDADGRFGLITAFDTIHDQARPRTVLAAIHGALADDGDFLMVDIAASSNVEENYEHPLGATLYMVSVFHCMTVSLAQDGEGLGTMWGEQVARELLAEAGFGDVRVERVEGDILNSYYISRKA
jgi:SAM-dependent methyltransferase